MPVLVMNFTPMLLLGKDVAMIASMATCPPRNFRGTCVAYVRYQ